MISIMDSMLLYAVVSPLFFSGTAAIIISAIGGFGIVLAILFGDTVIKTIKNIFFSNKNRVSE